MTDRWFDVVTLLAYALYFVGASVVIASLVHLWNGWQERRFRSGLDKLGRIDNPERFRVEEPYDYEAAMWTR